MNDRGLKRDAFGRRGLNTKLRRKLKESEMDTRSYHSLSYHRYFENYTEYQVWDQNGRKKIVRRYTGPVYSQDISGCLYVLLRAGYVCLYAAMLLLLVSVGIQERAGDTTWYIVLSEMATIIFLSFLGFNLLVNYLFLPRRMTSGDYNSSSKGLCRKALGTAVCFGGNAIFTLLYIIGNHSSAGVNDWCAFGKFLAAAAAAAVLFLAERRIPYEKTEARERETEDGGVEILC